MNLLKFDYYLFLPSLILIILGSFILSSVAPTAYPQQFIFLFAAFIGFVLFAKMDLRILKASSSYLYILSIGLLGFTVLFGALSRGAVRWIDLGLLTIQPSEIAKPFFILFLATIVSKSISNLRFLHTFLAFVPLALLIFIQPDFGSTIVISAAFIGVIFLANMPYRYFLAGFALILLLAPLLWIVLADFQKQRIYSYLSPTTDPLGAGYNSIQATIAVGSGGLAGRGLGQGTQSQLLFLPERHTDFVFAALSEELGFLGSVLLVIAFGALLTRLVIIMQQTEDNFSRAILGGIFAMIFVQAAVNIGMNLGVLPITGIPLPFVSSGGSSLFSMSITIGIASAVADLHVRHKSSIM